VQWRSILLAGALLPLGCGGAASYMGPPPPPPPPDDDTQGKIVDLYGVKASEAEEGTEDKDDFTDGDGPDNPIIGSGKPGDEKKHDHTRGGYLEGGPGGGELSSGSPSDGGGVKAATTISGKLPPEVIQRVVQKQFPRIRKCYADGLRDNPMLEGRMAVRLVIEKDGSVSSASDAGSTMPDRNVSRCVLRTFHELHFPEPEGGGLLTLVYPIAFDPGHSTPGSGKP
jgi:hypothetical protein